jgi:hypothetical protein
MFRIDRIGKPQEVAVKFGKILDFQAPKLLPVTGVLSIRHPLAGIIQPVSVFSVAKDVN